MNGVGALAPEFQRARDEAPGGQKDQCVCVCVCVCVCCGGRGGNGPGSVLGGVRADKGCGVTRSAEGSGGSRWGSGHRWRCGAGSPVE